MVMTDPIADLLTRLRNAARADHDKVDIPHSKIKEAIVKILKDEGFIANYRVIDVTPAAVIRVYFRAGAGKDRGFKGLVRVSTPGRRVYVAKDKVPRVVGGMGVAILSTSAGILTDAECRRRRVGGEVLLKAW